MNGIFGVCGCVMDMGLSFGRRIGMWLMLWVGFGFGGVFWDDLGMVGYLAEIGGWGYDVNDINDV